MSGATCGREHERLLRRRRLGDDDHAVAGDRLRHGRADERVVVDDHHPDHGVRRGHPGSAAASDVDAENGAVRMTSVPVSGEEAIRSRPPMSAARSRIDARP